MSGSAGTGSYSVIIRAVDQATAQINAINRRLAAINAPVIRLQRSLKTLAERSGLDDLVKGFSALGHNAFSVLSAIGRIVGPLGAITGAASIIGIYKLAESWSVMGTALQKNARRSGVAVDSLKTLQGAARLTGTTAEVLTSGITTLNDNMTRAVGGRAPEFVSMMMALGINFHRNAMQAKTAAEMLPVLANAIGKIRNPALQAEAATVAFGAAGESLLPFLRDGEKGISAYVDMARHYGVMTEEDTDKAKEFLRQQVALGLSFEGLTNTIMRDLAPVLGPLLVELAEWVNLNKVDISHGINEAVTNLGAAIRGIDWKKTKEELRHLGDEIQEVVTFFGGWQRAGELLGAVLLFRVLAPIVSISFALARLVGIAMPVWLLTLLGAIPAAGAAVVATAGAALLLPTNTDSEESDLARWREGAELPHTSDLPSDTRLWWNDFLSSRTGRSAEFSRGLFGLPRPPNLPRGPSGRRPADMGALVDYFRGQNYTAPQIAGILGTLQPESGFDLADVGDGGMSGGLLQWNRERRLGFRMRYGHDVTEGSTLEQAQFLQWELTHTHKAAGDALRQARTAFEAGYGLRHDAAIPADLERESVLSGNLAERWLPRVGGLGTDVHLGNGTGERGATDSAVTVNGSANVNIRLHGFPQGTSSSATTAGELFAPPRIVYPMPLDRALP